MYVLYMVDVKHRGMGRSVVEGSSWFRNALQALRSAHILKTNPFILSDSIYAYKRIKKT